MVSSIGSMSGGYDAAQIQQMRSQAADRLLKAVDTNQDGKITADELSTAMGAQGDVQSSSTSEIFKQLDQGNKGYITKQDLEDGLAKAQQGQETQSQQTQAPQSATPPGGGAAAAGGGGGSAPTAGSSSTSASTTTSYDPADLNQDGTVTMQERTQYALKLYEAQKETSSSGRASVYA